jgi:DNA repair photolyase
MIKELEVKTIDRNSHLPDTYFIAKYKCCPYRACSHGCKYCDGRSEKYYVAGDFEKDIVVRKNLPQILDASLSKWSEKGVVSFSSGVSDAYQPIESKYHLSRACGEIVLKHGFPAMVMTKSDLILKDLDLWHKVHKKAGFMLLMSLAYLEDDFRKKIEPNASSIESRLKTLKAFKSKGIPVGVLAMPMLPFLGDQKHDLLKMLEKLKEIEVDFVIPGGLTLRPGINKETYFKTLSLNYPHLLKDYKKLYSENRLSGVSTNDQTRNLEHFFYSHGIPIRMPHKLYKGRMPLYDEIYILLTHMCLMYNHRGIDTKVLKQSHESYKQWLIRRKKYYNRRKSSHYLDLESEVRFMIEGDEMVKLLKNEKLTLFLKEIIYEDKTFNYISLKLE